MLRFLVGMPAYRRHVDVGHLYQMMQLASECSRGNLRLQGLLDIDTCFVDHARNVLLKRALDAGAHWLLMCDSDVFSANPKPVMDMIAEGEAREAAVIAAPYRRRNAEAIFNVAMTGESPRFVTQEEFDGRVLEVDRIGTGFMAIRLGWFHEHWPKQPWFWTETLEGDEPAKRSEDFSFCDQVRKRGGLILCDGRFEPAHVTAL